MPKTETTADPLDTAFPANWLTEQVLPAVEYVVPGIIPEGLTLLVAPPKIGKSWMVLGLGVAAATGGLAFGSIPVDGRPVLYLALEDGTRRLQSRLRTLGVTTGPTGLYFMTDVPSGAITTIEAFLDRHADDKPLIILDTLGKVRGTYGGNDAYGNDYAQMSALKDLVDRQPGSSLIVVHHTNKGAKEDFLDSVSGTQGLAGAADSILLIQRDRQTESSTLHVTSRDAMEGQYALSLSNGTWNLDGSSLRDAAEAVRHRASTAGVGDDMAGVVNIVNRYPGGIRRKEIEDLAHLDAGTLGSYLRRATDAGRINNPKRGIYTPATSAISAISTEEPLLNVAHMANVAPLSKEAS